MSETKVFEGELMGGVNFEVHVQKGFSDRLELAVTIEGRVASVITVEKKRRTGSIVCKPVQSGSVIIKKTVPVKSNESAPNLEGVLETPAQNTGSSDEPPAS